MTATVMIVHGAWRGAWRSDLVLEQLGQRHVPVVGLDLAGGEDTELAEAIQFRTDGTIVVEWPTSHSPFVARPELVSELLATLARTVAL